MSSDIQARKRRQECKIARTKMSKRSTEGTILPALHYINRRVHEHQAEGMHGFTRQFETQRGLMRRVAAVERIAVVAARYWELPAATKLAPKGSVAAGSSCRRLGSPPYTGGGGTRVPGVLALRSASNGPSIYQDFFHGTDYLEAVLNEKIRKGDMVLILTTDGAQLYRSKPFFNRVRLLDDSEADSDEEEDAATLQNEFVDVHFYFILELEQRKHFLAVGSFFGPPCKHLLDFFFGNYWSFQHQRDTDVRAFKIQEIESVVMMGPDHQYRHHRDDEAAEDRWFYMEKPFLKGAHWAGHDESDEDMDDVDAY
ncbi:hypothetical protein R3P38DRAFT_2804607 [Favolaschia claudopus]|uniref:Uncharacterized protein n=1 Tax=Favolaschia claudopus TaxID=2862362 RepID=A0AAV9ZPK3_9AGAR